MLKDEIITKIERIAESSIDEEIRLKALKILLKYHVHLEDEIEKYKRIKAMATGLI